MGGKKDEENKESEESEESEERVEESPLVKESDSVHTLWATGRHNCDGLLVLVKVCGLTECLWCILCNCSTECDCFVCECVTQQLLSSLLATIFAVSVHALVFLYTVRKYLMLLVLSQVVVICM